MSEFTSIGTLASAIVQKVAPNIASCQGVGHVVATAVQLHVRALRLLDRKDTTIIEVASALSLPESVVERVFRESAIVGATLSEHVRAKTGPMSKVVKLKVARQGRAADAA